jgi:hypothetical protein
MFADAGGTPMGGSRLLSVEWEQESRFNEIPVILPLAATYR